MSMSPHYGETIGRIVDNVLIPFFKSMDEDPSRTIKVTLYGKGGKFRGVEICTNQQDITKKSKFSW